jgi:hypothetical protein
MTLIAGRWWHNPRTVKGVLLAVAIVLSGCYGLPTTPLAPGDCGFPPGTHFSFIGKASRAELGFPNGDSLVAEWWVSSERLPWVGHWKANMPIPPPSPQACGAFPDGSIGLQILPLDWHPPFDAVSS